MDGCVLAMILVTMSHGAGAGGGHLPPADLVIRGAVIHTASARAPRATAMAIRHGRIVQIGNEPSVSPLIGGGTRVVDLHGRTVLPGLVDSHAHMAGLGNLLAQVNVAGTTSYEAVVESARARAARTPAGEWIEGRGWDQNRWPDRAFPTHHPLSAAVPDHPVALKRVDGHALLVNRAALERARITRDTPDPPGGRILRDAAGEPTGVLVDNAADLVTAVIPPLGPAERQARLRAALRECARHGLTMVHDAGITAETWDAYQALQARGELPIRVAAMADVPGTLADELIAHGPRAGDRLWLRTLKVVADGALGSRGALLSADYSDQPGQRGLVTFPFDSLERVAARARARGLQMRVHCIGDLAATRTLDAFERAAAGHSIRALRWAIEHAQVVRPEDVPRFAGLGVTASMQTTHATSDASWAESRLGPERIGWSYAWRRFLAAGVRFANGSDFPVESVDPRRGLYTAITRRDPEETLPAEGWRPEERLTPEEALRSFTSWGAWLAFRERDLGSLEIGKQADFVVLDRDVVGGPPEEILRAEVLQTVVAGETVYEAGAR